MKESILVSTARTAAVRVQGSGTTTHATSPLRVQVVAQTAYKTVTSKAWTAAGAALKNAQVQSNPDSSVPVMTASKIKTSKELIAEECARVALHVMTKLKTEQKEE